MILAVNHVPANRIHSGGRLRAHKNDAQEAPVVKYSISVILNHYNLTICRTYNKFFIDGATRAARGKETIKSRKARLAKYQPAEAGHLKLIK
jgi:hypothetical protein